MPERIQRKRTAGWRMPEGAVYVGRPTDWGNPWKVGDTAELTSPTDGALWGHVETAEAAVAMYAAWMACRTDLADLARAALAGKDLACWCPIGSPCHADVLLRIANPPAEDGASD